MICLAYAHEGISHSLYIPEISSNFNQIKQRLNKNSTKCLLFQVLASIESISDLLADDQISGLSLYRILQISLSITNVFIWVDKALLSIEEDAERIYTDVRGFLLEDEAASTRDAMYDQAEFIGREMEQMPEHIKSIIQTLNASQGGDLDAIDGMNPLDVVVRILNNQLSSLMWIDEKAGDFLLAFKSWPTLDRLPVEIQ